MRWLDFLGDGGCGLNCRNSCQLPRVRAGVHIEDDAAEREGEQHDQHEVVASDESELHIGAGVCRGQMALR